MTESGSSALGSNSELDDPGRDPKGLNPPRNLFGGSGAGSDTGSGSRDQDSGQGAPDGTGNVGPGDKPEAPTDEPETRADTEDSP